MEPQPSINPAVDPEVKAEIEKILSMDHVEMCRLWRFSPPGHKYFDGSLPYFEFFKWKLFQFYGGFTPSISKLLS